MPWTWTTAALSVRLVHPLANLRPSINTTQSIKWPKYNKRYISQHIKDEPTTPSPAQTSRAAWQAVRLSLKSLGGVESALLIVNSLRYSTFKQDPIAQHPLSVTIFGSQLASPLRFTQNTSPRLASHALLHGLIRLRRNSQAQQLAVEMMEAGIQLRTRTVTTLMRSYSPLKPPRVTPTPTLPLSKSYIDPKRSLNDVMRMTENSGTKMALEIFAVAKKTRQHNANGILATLIAICLVNAEVILASLVFAFVVKEFHNTAADGATSEVGNTPPFPRPKTSSNSARLIPIHEMLFSIVRPIRHVLEKPNPHSPGSYEDSQHTLQVNSSLQALTNLAFLLDERLIPISSLSHLIKTMYHCPRVGYEVWIAGGNSDVESDQFNSTPRKVTAYSYLHAVLRRLIADPPRYRRHPNTTIPVTFPLNLGACNTLLHYSLRHLTSPTLANSVLQYMVMDRGGRWALEPDETTYAILARSGTLLRNKELWDAALNGLGKTVRKKLTPPSLSTDKQSDLTPTPAPTVAPSPPPIFPLPLPPSIAPHVRPRSSYALPDTTTTTISPAVMAIIHRLRSLDLSDLASRSEMPQLLHSLTTLFMGYISTGEPELVYFLHYELFPELNIPLVGIGSWGEKLYEKDAPMRLKGRFGMRRGHTSSRRRDYARMSGVGGTKAALGWGITAGHKRTATHNSRTLPAPTPAELKERKLARRAMVIRASKYGPRLFSVILTGLLKANRVGAAKAFWKFAQRAERMSWERGGLSAYTFTGLKERDAMERERARVWEPWVLDESAYTTMLQVLRAEWEAPLKKRSGRVEPNSSEEEKAEVTEAVRQMLMNRGVAIYRQMKRIQWEVEEALLSRQKRVEERTGKRKEREIKIGKEGVDEVMKALRFPVMDARFLSAAIALLVLPAITGVRYPYYRHDRLSETQFSKPIATKKPPRSLVMRDLDILERLYAETGHTVQVATDRAPILDEIGRDLVEAGFDVPPGLRKLFLGKGLRMTGGAGEGVEGRPPLVQMLHPHPPVVPFRFPDAKPGWQPLLVPSMRTRGLPKAKARFSGVKKGAKNTGRRGG